MTGRFDLGQHLVEIVNVGWRVESQSLFQLMVGRGGDSRLSRAADVDRDAVGLLMIDGSQYAFAGFHGRISWHNAAMNSGVVPQQPPMNWAPASSSARGVCGELLGRRPVDDLAVDHFRDPGIGLDPERLVGDGTHAAADVDVALDALTAVGPDHVGPGRGQSLGRLLGGHSHHRAIVMGTGVEHDAGDDGQAGLLGRGECQFRFLQFGHRLDHDARRHRRRPRRRPVRQMQRAVRSAEISPEISILPLGPIEAKTRARSPAARREISTPARLISTAWSARS